MTFLSRRLAERRCAILSISGFGTSRYEVTRKVRVSRGLGDLGVAFISGIGSKLDIPSNVCPIPNHTHTYTYIYQSVCIGPPKNNRILQLKVLPLRSPPRI